MSDNNNSFSIESTENVAGDQALIDSLLSPETASATPDEVTANKDEEDTPDEQPSQEEQPSQKFVENFLEAGEDDEDEEEAPSSPPIDKKVPEDDVPEDDIVPDTNQFKALANDLVELGIFKQNEGEELTVETPEDFLEAFKKAQKQGAIEMVEEIVSQYGDDYAQAFEAIFVKGANPKKYFESYNQVVSFAEMDMEKESNQIKVVREFLKSQEFEEEDINAEIERLQNYGDLDTVAKRNHKVLVKKEAAKLTQMEQQAQQEQLQKQQMKQQYAANVQDIVQKKLQEKEFDGIPLNKKVATELQDFLVTDKWKTASGELLTDFDKTILDLKRPENHEMKVKVALLLKTLEQDPTLSTIKKAGVSKQSNELFRQVARQATRSSNSTTKKSVNTDSWFK